MEEEKSMFVSLKGEVWHVINGETGRPFCGHSPFISTYGLTAETEGIQTSRDVPETGHVCYNCNERMRSVAERRSGGKSTEVRRLEQIAEKVSRRPRNRR